MSKRDYPYPPDEFDQVDLATRPKEVHAAKRSAWSRIWPFLLVVVVVPAAAIIAVKLMSNPMNPGSGGSMVTETPSISSQAPNTPPPESSAGPNLEPTLEPTSDPSEAPPFDAPNSEAVVDYTTAITVMNDVSNAYTGTKNQLAARTAARLITTGFTAATTSTSHIQNGRPTSVVYYSSPQAKATADVVAQAIGITMVQEDAAVAGSAIVVSLGDDFREQ